MGELPTIEDAQRVELHPDTWLIVNIPEAAHDSDHYTAEFAELAHQAHERSALLVAMPPGYTVEQLPAVELERAGWIRFAKLDAWRKGLEAIRDLRGIMDDDIAGCADIAKAALEGKEPPE